MRMSKNGELRIGWATEDVTPSEPVFLRGQFHARIATEVHDLLTVTALAIESVQPDGGTEQAVIVSCDRVMVENGILDEVRSRLTGAVDGLDPQKVVLNATHTHTAPEVRSDQWPDPGRPVMDGSAYAKFFVDGVVSAIKGAWRGRKPGVVNWGYGHAVVGHNRRACYLDHSARMYGQTNVPEFSHIEGWEDHGVDLLFTWGLDGRLTGLIVNLASPSQVTEGANWISADFWHDTRVELRRRLGANIFVLPQCSPAGDQSPHLLVHKREEQRMLELREISERQEIAMRIADAVDRVLAVVQSEHHTALPMHHIVREIQLTRRRISEAELQEAEREEQRSREEYERLLSEKSDDYRAISIAFSKEHWYGTVRERYRLQHENPKYPVELHVIRLGDVAFATNPFELFLDFGLRIKARGPAVQHFLIQLAGSIAELGSAPYVPTERAVAGKSYGAEPLSNTVGPEGGQELVEETLHVLNELWQ